MSLSSPLLRRGPLPHLLMPWPPGVLFSPWRRLWLYTVVCPVPHRPVVGADAPAEEALSARGASVAAHDEAARLGH